MEYINLLSSDVTEIDICFNDLIELPNLSRFTCLQNLDCSNNQLCQLDKLPFHLQILDCSQNQLSRLNNLPYSLKELNCSRNIITQLDI